jgi:peptidyl-prolyl cis-trans isomerase D
MLLLFRRKKDWLKWTLLLVILALGFTTVLLFVDTPSGLVTGIGAQEVAKVAGSPITAAEYGRQYRRLLETYRQLYNLDRQDPNIIRQLGIEQAALNQLISMRALSYQAEQLGLSVPAEELQQEISRLFQQNGQFVGKERYQQILRGNNLSPKAFEDSMRQDLINEKLRRIVTDGITATDDEIRQDFVTANQEVSVRYVVFDPEAIEPEEPTDEALQKYFDENQEDFQRPEERKIKYISVRTTPDQVEVTEEQIKEELDKLPEEDQVRARHILISTAEGDEAAREEAQTILEQLQGGADFEELAKANSDDPGTAEFGGDLGFFGRGRMVPEFEEAAFALEPGEISGLVKTPFGYHIIQTIEKASTDPASKNVLAEFNARLSVADAQSEELANQVMEEAKAGATLEEVAEKYSLQVVESPNFDPSGTVPGLALRGDAVSTLGTLAEGELSGPHAATGRWVIAQMAEIVPAQIPELAEIRDEVLEAYQSSERDRLLEEHAFGFFEEAETAESFSDLAAEKSYQVISTDFFKKGANIDDNLRFSPDIHEQAFALPVGGISTPVSVAGKYIVFQVAEKSAVDEERFEREKPDLLERLTQQKRAEFFNTYVENLVDELRRNQEIIINQELVSDLTS